MFGSWQIQTLNCDVGLKVFGNRLAIIFPSTPESFASRIASCLQSDADLKIISLVACSRLRSGRVCLLLRSRTARRTSIACPG
jgi:hypothetical protein